MTTTIAVITIEDVSCGVCGIHFGLEASFKANALDDGRWFYCPQGHKISWRASNEREATLERTRRERDAARSLARREGERRRTAEYRRRAAKGQLTKIRNRLARGLCPCCGKGFPEMAAHLAERHPDFVVPEELGIGESKTIDATPRKDNNS